jgi:hypothetical protein
VVSPGCVAFTLRSSKNWDLRAHGPGDAVELAGLTRPNRGYHKDPHLRPNSPE